MKYLWTLMLVSASAFPATWDQLPIAHGLDDADPKYIEKHFARLHPWKPGAPLPMSFEDAGLKRPVKLVASNLYLDGGSRVYLFRGANRKYLMVCTDAGFHGSSGKNAVEVDKPRLFLAAAHFTGERKVAVPYDSPSERFLLVAIKSEVDRINASRKAQT